MSGFFKTPDEIPFAHIAMFGNRINIDLQMMILFDIGLRFQYFIIIMLALPLKYSKMRLT